MYDDSGSMWRGWNNGMVFMLNRVFVGKLIFTLWCLAMSIILFDISRTSKKKRNGTLTYIQAQIIVHVRSANDKSSRSHKRLTFLTPLKRCFSQNFGKASGSLFPYLNLDQDGQVSKRHSRKNTTNIQQFNSHRRGRRDPLHSHKGFQILFAELPFWNPDLSSESNIYQQEISFHW